MDTGSVTALVDAQITNAFILGTYTNFQTRYNGRSSRLPIYFSELGEAKDELAGDPGYSPQLQRGLPVPMGAKVIVWLPKLFYLQASSPAVINGYVYSFTWRLRNVFDFRKSPNRKHYHFGQQTPGVPDTNAAVGQQERTALPAANQSVTYVQTEPSSNLVRAVQNVREEDLRTLGLNLSNGISPDSAVAPGTTTFMDISQGLFDPAVTTTGTQPSFLVHEMTALGDELLIGIRREDANPSDWDLAAGGTDVQILNFFGTGLGTVRKERGVYVFTGTGF